MSVHVLQAVLREAEAVAYCHRIQVWAKREQVCIRDLFSINCIELWKKWTSVWHLSPQILFAALITVYICIMINGIMLVNDICKIPCQYESPFQPYAYLVQFGF